MTTTTTENQELEIELEDDHPRAFEWAYCNPDASGIEIEPDWFDSGDYDRRSSGSDREDPIELGVGIVPRPPFAAETERLGAPAMVSANSLWNHERRSWSVQDYLRNHSNLWLDSGGFVAANIYGGYRWTFDEYLDLVADLRPAQYFTLDLCCEPELNVDTEERIETTVENWRELTLLADRRHLRRPAIVITGTSPEDYVKCLLRYSDELANYDVWPNMIGIGTLCRRDVPGILSVLAAVDEFFSGPYAPRLAPKYHLFGVKGAALGELRDHPKVLSADSMAWAFRARVTARELGIPASNAHKLEHLRAWRDRHLELLS